MSFYKHRCFITENKFILKAGLLCLTSTDNTTRNFVCEDTNVFVILHHQASRSAVHQVVWPLKLIHFVIIWLYCLFFSKISMLKIEDIPFSVLKELENGYPWEMKLLHIFVIRIIPDSQHCAKRLTEFSVGTEVYCQTIFATTSCSQVL